MSNSSHAWWRRLGESGSWRMWLLGLRPGASPTNPGVGEAEADLPRQARRGVVALEAERGPYGAEKRKRLVVAITDLAGLPEHTTCYLRTNIPALGSGRAEDGEIAPVGVPEVVRPYGLRSWVEQIYKQVKQSLDWAQ